ncbi:MAG TPA: hypothetical protein VF306_05890 [Pirellulales bacterium]
MPYPHVIRLRGPWQYTPLAACGDRRLPPPGRIELPADWGATLGDDFRGRVRYERSFNSPTNLDPHERVWLVIDGADPRADVYLNRQSLGTVEGYALSAEWDISERIGPRNTLSLEIEQLDGGSQKQPFSPTQPGHRQGSAPATGGALHSAFRTPHSALDEGSAPATVGQSKIQNRKSKISPPRPGRVNLPGGPVGQVRLEIRSTAFIEDLSLWISVEESGTVLHCCGRIRGDSDAGPLYLVVGALERELLYENVAIGEPFEHTAEAGDMPVWAPGKAGRLTTVEIKLLSGGEAVWQRQLDTAAIATASQCTEKPAPDVSFVSGDLVQQVDKLLQQVDVRRPCVVMHQTLPEPLYAAFDRAGVAVLQTMPLEWSSAVCLRLAHHPSVSAWCLPPDSPQRPVAPSAPFLGRPWAFA